VETLRLNQMVFPWRRQWSKLDVVIMRHCKQRVSNYSFI
jgi:hypothetical protein